jgi:hypothetical protein
MIPPIDLLLPLLRKFCSFEQNFPIQNLLMIDSCQLIHPSSGGNTKRPFLQKDTVIGVFGVCRSYEHLVPVHLSSVDSKCGPYAKLQTPLKSTTFQMVRMLVYLTECLLKLQGRFTPQLVPTLRSFGGVGGGVGYDSGVMYGAGIGNSADVVAGAVAGYGAGVGYGGGAVAGAGVGGASKERSKLFSDLTVKNKLVGTV